MCPHPNELDTIKEVTGHTPFFDRDFPYEKVTFGIKSHCICVTCTQQFGLDINREERKCPSCGSGQVYTELEMVGKECPKCNMGKIEEIYTGAIS